MKRLKRTAAGLLLAGVMCVQALPMTAWAVDITSSDAVAVTDTAPTIVEATTNAATEVQCDIDQTDYFTFEERGDGNYIVTGVTPAFRELENVAVTTGSKISCIYSEAFKDCTNLKSIDFECEEMQLLDYAFSGCTALSKVAFEKIAYVGSLAFEKCQKLTSVNLTNTKLYGIGDLAFAGCPNIEEIVISMTDEMADANYGTSGYGIGEMIFGNSEGKPYKLTFQMNMLKKDHFAIYGTSFHDGRVQEVTFEGEGDVNIVSDAFSGNENLKYFDFSKVAYVGDSAFSECKNLHDIQLTSKKLRMIGDHAFANCESANNIQLRLNDDLEIGENPFYRNYALDNNEPYSMTIYANNREPYAIPEHFEEKDHLLDTLEVIGDGKVAYTDYAFANCESLKEASFGNATYFGQLAFSKCTKLKEVNITKARTIRSEAFSGCEQLKSLKLGVFDDSDWEAGAFRNSMTAITDDTGNVISSTIELYLSNEKTTFSIGEKNGYIFSSMSNLVSVKTYGNGKILLNNGQFSNCPRLESFDFSNVVYIGSEVMHDTGLKDVKISQKDIQIGNSSFLNCPDLTLYGYTGSTVEEYATANSIPFVALDGGTTTTSTTRQGSSTTTTTVTTQGNSGTILLGDITLDGRVDISDAVLLNKATAGSVMLNEQAKDNAECYADGNIDANDSTALLQFLVHTIASLPVRE